MIRKNLDKHLTSLDSPKMLIVVVLLSILAAASSTPVNSSYTFDLYMNDFHLQYDSHELETRRAMFETELKRVIAHNSKTHLKWKETMNKFSVLTATGTNF